MPLPRDKIEAILLNGNWFGDLPAEVRSALMEALTVRTLTDGQHIFRLGDAPSGLHAVLQGAIRVTGLAEDGHETIMSIVRCGDWTGFLACLDRQPHAFSGAAIGPSQVASIPASAVSEIFERDVSTYRFLLLPELTVWRKTVQAIIADSGASLRRRLAVRLADLGRWTHGAGDGPAAPLEQVSQEELAMSVRASRQKVNATLREFEARGLVKLGYGRIQIVDADGLKRFSRDD